MRRLVPRALRAAFLVATVAGCASGGGGAGVPLGTDTGGRVLVMIPDLEGPSGQQVASELRNLVMNMTTHVPLATTSVREQMREYQVEQLGEIEALQLAQLMSVPMVSWGTVRQNGTGFEADMKFIDVRSNDQVLISGVTGATPQELAAGIHAGFEERVDGLRNAIFCNDYLASQSYEQALERCNDALAVLPNSVTSLYGKATSLLYLERYEEALATYDQLLQIDPAHPDALLGAGLAASNLSERQRAMGYYNRYLEVNPGNVSVRITVANDIAQAGDYVSAFRVLETAIEDNQDNAGFQTYLFNMGAAAGRSLREEGDTAQATDILNEAYRAYQAGYADSTQISVAATQRAIEVLSALGRTDDAIRMGQEATQRNPNETSLWGVYASALREAGRTDEEIEALTRWATLDPQNENVYARRAQAYDRAGRRDDAIADANRLGELNAETAATVLYTMAGASYNARNYAEAERALVVAQRYATGETKMNVDYILGASILVPVGQGVTEAAQAGNVQAMQELLPRVQRAHQVLQASGHPQAPQLVSQAQQLIDYLQQALQRPG